MSKFEVDTSKGVSDARNAHDFSHVQQKPPPSSY